MSFSRCPAELALVCERFERDARILHALRRVNETILVLVTRLSFWAKLIPWI
jgi:hypothetical protein